MRIRVIDAPPGEAPSEIRRAWIGIVLPVAGRAATSRTLRSVGVLTGPKSLVTTLLRVIFGRLRKVTGYPVEADLAFEALERHAPEAEAWWRQNTPYLYGSRRCLMFHAQVCEPVLEESATA